MIHNLKIALVALLLSLASLASAVAQVNEPEEGKGAEPTKEWKKMTPQEYIYMWRHIAVEHMELYGIPASITMGQAILESGFGNGYLARVANNHFCIKCKKSWTGPTITHSDDRPDDCFRVYDTVEASYRDHAEFLNEGQRYEFLFAYASDDYKSWAHGLKKAGYATAPDYAERLIGTIERYNLQLLDGKDGIAAYDAYVAGELGIDPKRMQSAEGAKGAEGADDAQSLQSGVVEEYIPRDATMAYADRGIDPNNFRVTINSHHGYSVYLTNGAYYIIAKEGDSFASLGELFMISPNQLRRYNDLDEGCEPRPGDVVYIERKMSRWEGKDMLHSVESGETLHFIAQLYGVRVKSLAKLNRLKVDATLQTGQTLKLR
jgi:hypothetical protein